MPLVHTTSHTRTQTCNRVRTRARAHTVARIAALFASVLLTPGAARAAEPASQTLLIGGGQASANSGFGYAGAILPWQGAQVGQGWFTKAVASWVSYRYGTLVGGSTVEVRANSPGVEGGVGYAWGMGTAFTGDASLALGARYTSISPEVPTDGPKGARVMLTPQVFGRYDATPFVNAELRASYSFGTRDRFAKARLGWHPAPPWRVGLELVQAAGTTYRDVQRGVFAGAPVAPGWWVDVNAGSSRARDGKQGHYIGLSTSRVL